MRGLGSLQGERILIVLKIPGFCIWIFFNSLTAMGARERPLLN
jgi:hypothetical protein